MKRPVAQVENLCYRSFHVFRVGQRLRRDCFEKVKVKCSVGCALRPILAGVDVRPTKTFHALESANGL